MERDVDPCNSTPPSPTSFHLRIARFSDLAAIASCWFSAFFDDEVIGVKMHPHRKQFPEDVYWFLLRGIRERFWDWRHQFIVVTTENKNGKRGKIIGAANWRRLGEGGKVMELWKLDPRNMIQPAFAIYHGASLLFWPNRAADPQYTSFLVSAVARSEKHWTGDRAECWDLYVCGVDSQFQGKGVGRMLVEWGLQKACEENTCASVMCGEKNRGFYAKGGLTEEMKQPGSGEGRGIMLFTGQRSQLYEAGDTYVGVDYEVWA